MIVSLTGATGNMGFAVLQEVLKLEFVDKVRVLVYNSDKRLKNIVKLKNSKIEIILGNIADSESCDKLVSDADYVVNMAAVIPPFSDKNPKKAIECNEIGADVLVSSIEKLKKQPKFIHISTVALYGNRNSKHPWARVGDPLLVSPFDIYSLTKLRGEFRVLESNIKKFAVLRQTACLYNNFVFENLHDGLMFHTCFNSPLEWLTVEDSGVLIANIIKRDTEQKDLDKVFWNKCFNIGGGAQNRITGYDTFNEGLKLFGASAKDLFQPNYNATRNFHGVWFYDGDKLENLFHYQRTSVTDFWKRLIKKHWYIKLARIVPKKLIKKFTIDRLLKDSNSTRFWIEHNDTAKIIAYFGGMDNYEKIAKNWKDFPLLVENFDENGKNIDYFALKDIKNANLIDYHFNIDADPTLEDLQNVAKAHGGELVSKHYAGLYEKLVWKNSEGVEFSARPYTVLFAGHWFNRSYEENIWYFDKLSKSDKIYSQIWLDSHFEKENYTYFYDADFNSQVR